MSCETKMTLAPSETISRISLNRVSALSEQRQVVCLLHSYSRPKWLSDHERAPLAERGRASLFVDFAGDEMTFLVEMVVDLSMN
jgi:hypothetical protein